MKKWIAISFNTILLGWFPFMWLCMFGSESSTELRLIAILGGMILCVIGGLAFITLFNDKKFWLNREELENCIKEYKETIEEYNKAKEKLESYVLNRKEDE